MLILPITTPDLKKRAVNLLFMLLVIRIIILVFYYFIAVASISTIKSGKANLVTPRRV